MSAYSSFLPSISDFAPAVVLSQPYPVIEGGRYPVKRIEGETLKVFIDVFKDGHDVLMGVVKWRKVGAEDATWREKPLQFVDNDRWTADLVFPEIGLWEYTFEAWPDSFRTWKKGFLVKLEAQTDDVAIELLEGGKLFEQAAERARLGGDRESAEALKKTAQLCREFPAELMADLIRSKEIEALLDCWSDRTLATTYHTILQVCVERALARFSAWYEFFPRNAEGRADKHSTFRDCVERLDYVKDLGFDVVYFPPIHPIGVTNRKGKNNALTADPEDVGSPWAIGAKEGGYRDVHPDLGTLEDFDWLLQQAKERGIEIALDFAINCSPDHPYVKDHPDWFHQRVDGSIRYAENPPKKYQDIYPIHFHGEDWEALWAELIDVVKFWVKRGVRIFRVDNPHTKPVAFWERLIKEVRELDPGVIFLAEAFTRPRMMEMLGKIGYSQSYTYFTWRETKQELTEYVTELTHGEMRWFYRGNFWPNTPDILPKHLQFAGLSSFRIRAALAALLSSNWGIYSGFEFGENEPYPGKEEYVDNEKYQLRDRDYTQKGIRGLIRELNRLRREHRALQQYDSIQFCETNHEQILSFLKVSEDRSSRILVVISLHPTEGVAGSVKVPLHELGLGADTPYPVNDLLHGVSYTWHSEWNYVELSPERHLLHVFEI